MKEKILLSNSNLRGSEFIFKRNEFFVDFENIINFEKSLEKYLGVDHKVVALNSGTAAIHLALILAGVKKDDYVICQSFTFVASANPIRYQGANPIFIDSEVETWGMCPIFLEEAIKDRILKGKKPKAIIMNSSYGMPSKIETIVSIAKLHGIQLIEDAASSLGSSYSNKKCGTFGDFGIISFNNNKIVTTFGGGILICKNEEEKNKAIYLATQAKEKYNYYQHSEIGYNYRMSNILAGIGRGQMDALDKHIDLRRKNNQFYQDLFKEVDGITVFEEHMSDYFSNHWLSCILIDEDVTGFSSEDLRLHLEKDNLESRPLWKPMHLQPLFKEAPYYGAKVAENLFEKGLCLPSGSDLTENDLKRIAKSINNFLYFR